MLWKVVWRCATVVCGEQCVVIYGEEEMQQLFADSLDTPAQVC